MSVGHNATMRRYLDLIDSGELDRARHGAKDQAEWAARVGMTIGQFRGVQRRAEQLGLTVPRWSDPTSRDAYVPATDGRLADETSHNTPDVTGYGCGSPASIPAAIADTGSDNCHDFADEEPTRPNIGQSEDQRPETGRDDQELAGLLDEMLAETGGPTTDEERRTADTALGVLNAGTTVRDSSTPPLPAIGRGFHVRGKSTLVRPDGSIAGQWIKTAANANAVDPVEVLRAAFGSEMPKSEPAEAPRHSNEDLLCVYPMGDPHIGMLAWEKDAGENFDLAVVERNLFAAVDQLVTLAPAADTALIVTVGDTFHSDGLKNATTAGTPVDVDGRTSKMIATGVRVFRRVIDRSLEKHRRAVVKIVPGNHDALLALVLQLALAQFYENDPRVEIDQSPQMHQWFRFGANLIGVTHGDKAKAADLMCVMAVDRAKDWGETRHRRIYAGHIHHEVVKELPGVTVEYLRTLASSDAWHRGQGYRSGRDMKMDVFHREYGLINRHVVGIEQVMRAS